MRQKSAHQSLKGAFALGIAAALVGGVVVVNELPAWSAPVQHEQTFNYTAGTQSWTVPAGVTQIEVALRGGQGGNGGDDAAGAPPISTYRGLVTGTIEVTPGQNLTIAVGQGGTTGLSSANGTQAGPAGGLNPLAGYDGGIGGRVGTAGSSGQGGGGGAATVLRIGGDDIVAGGGGGNGGSGQYAPTRGRTADGTFAPRTDGTSTDGQAGLQPSGGNNDGGGSGAGGGGAQGGTRGAVEFGAGTSTEWFGYGGSVGQNSTASFSGLTTSYEHVAQNQGNGTLVIRWDTGTAAAPAAPQGIAGVGEVDLAWNPPAQIGQGPIIDYQVQYSSDDGLTWSPSQLVDSDATEFTVTGLTNGTPYVFRVAAVTPVGVGDFSPKSNPITPYALPGAPVTTNIEPRDGALAVSFDPPSSGAPVTGYQYRVDGGAWVPIADPAQPIVIPGLFNGVEVDIELRATSAVGNGAASDPEPGTPRAVPGAPTVTGVTTGPGTGSVAFEPGFDGGSTITGYEYRVDGGAWTSLGASADSVDLTGLDPSESYDVEIRAINAAGPGAPSAPTRVTTPGLPGPLASASATSLDSALSVTFAQGANGGSPITRVEYSLDGGATWEPIGTAGPVTIPGLSNGVEQSVQLRAVNAVGAGPATTVAATPATVPGAPGITSVTDEGTGSLEVVFTPPASDGGWAITGYEYSTDGGQTWAPLGGVGSPASISEASDGSALYPDTRYPLSLRAVNGVGAGPASSAVNSNGPVPPVLASAPTIAGVVSQPSALSVTFTPGDNGGATVTEYQYSIDGGTTWQSTGSLSGQFVIGGLTDGTSYEVRVRTVTSVGDGASSTPAFGTPASPPAPPTQTSVQRGNGELTVALTAGSNGGSAITDYEYTIDGGTTWVSTGQATGPVTISGLNNGQSYTVQMRAINAVGTSGGSNQLTSAPAAVPPAPTLTLTPGDTTVSVSAVFAADGGAPLTKIEYSVDGGATWIDTHSLSGNIALTGLPNGTSTEVQVRGTNAIGTGPAETGSATPRTVPGPPTDVVAAGNTGSIDASWGAPASDGGAPITGYTAYAYSSISSTIPVGSCTTTGARQCTISGLSNGTEYFIAVAATNEAGTGPESPRRPSAMPLVRPGAPNLTAVSPGDQRLMLTFTPGAAGDRPIQGYEYTVDGGTTWLPLGTGSPATAQGLTNGTAYNVQVRAVSAAGPGAASNVRSGTPFGYPYAPTGIVVTPGSGNATVTWDPADLNGTTLARYTVTAFSAENGGTVVRTCQTTGTSCVLSPLTNGTTVWVSIQTEVTHPSTGATTYYSERSDPRIPVTPRVAGTAPTFDLPTRTADGYSVRITNYYAGSTYALDESALPPGASATRSDDTITVTGLAPNQSGVVGVTVSRIGYLDASASVLGTALAAGIAPIFGTPNRTPDGYTVVITNYDASSSYALDDSALPPGASATSAGDTVTVTGLDPGVSGVVDVTVSKTGSADASAPVTGSALDAGIVPTFDTPTRTVDGYTVVIANYDSDATYTLDDSELPPGASATRTGNTITVTGVDPGVSATVGVTVAKVGSTNASADVTGTALETGIAPIFGTPNRTPDGYTVEISNYDPAATYTLDDSELPPGATATRTGNTITVTGLDPGESATVGVSVSKTGSTDASADVTGTAQEIGEAPRLSKPTSTVDGFELTILNYDPDLVYTVTVTKGEVRVEGDRIIVTGLKPGESATVSVTASNSDTAVRSATAAGSALPTPGPDNGDKGDGLETTGALDPAPVGLLAATLLLLGGVALVTGRLRRKS